MTGLQIERIDSVAALRDLAPAWRALFEHVGSDLPFLRPEWIDAWWQHLRNDRLGARDHLSGVAVWRGDALVAVAPWVRTERPALGPMRLRYLHCVGADPNITEVRGLLVRPEEARAAMEAIQSHLRSSADWAWVRWTGLGKESDDALGNRLAARLPPNPCFLLELPSTWEALRNRVGRNLREALRKGYRALTRDGLRAELRVARGPALRDATERFFRLHAARARMERGRAHADVFAAPASKRFLHDVLGRLDAARVFELTVGGEVAASRVGFELGRSLYLYYSGFDPAWARHGVMTTALAEILKYAIAQRLERVNLSTGEDPSKTRWRPSRVDYGDGVQLAEGLAPRLAYALYALARH